MKYQITFGVNPLPFSQDVLGPYIHNGAIVFDCHEYLPTPDTNCLGESIFELREQVLFVELAPYHGDHEPPTVRWPLLKEYIKRAIFNAFIQGYCTTPELQVVGIKAMGRPYELFGHFCERAGVHDRLHNEMIRLLPSRQGPMPKPRFGDAGVPVAAPATGPSGPVVASSLNEAALEDSGIIMHGVATRKMVTLVIGVGHSGKSTHAMGIAAAVALGVDYGPYRIREQCNTLVINRENDHTEQVLRLGAAVRQLGHTMADLTDRLLLWSDSADAGFLAIKDKAGIVAGPFAQRLKALIKQHKIGVVVIDPLIDFAQGVRENDNADQHAFSRIATRMAADLDCAVILVHHATKNAIPDYNQATRGASALPYASRLGLLLRPRRNGEVVIRHGKWTGTQRLPDTVWKFVSHELPAGTGNAMDVAEMSVWSWQHRDALLGMIRECDDNPWPYALNGKDEERRLDLMAAARFDCQPEQIRLYLKALEDEGMVKGMEGKVRRVDKGWRKTKVWTVVDDEPDATEDGDVPEVEAQGEEA